MAMVRVTCSLLVLLTASVLGADWPHYGGGPDQMRYSPLTQISRENVGTLQRVWTYDTGDAFQGSEMQCQPVVAHGVLYATSPKLRVFALDAATGALQWSFDPNKDAKNPTRTRIRGLMYWERGDARRIYFGARHWLYALDARTGEPIPGFGQNGRIDLREGFAGRDARTLTVGMNTPGVFYRDLLILGSIVPEGLPSAPGDIRAFNVDTGRQQWSFHTIPHPGELGYDTWPKDAWQYSGGANAWSGVALDEGRGLVYASTGSAAYDFYGANRLGDNLFANTILCLRAATGERVWHFQGVKHDIWDRDFPAPPSLVTITRDGRRIDVVAQIAKNGRTYVLDRETGTPVFPMEPVTATASGVPGERASATQVLPALPPPFTRQRFTEDMITTRTPEAARGSPQAVADAQQGRRVRSAQPAGHHPVSRHGWRRRVGRHRVRPGLGPALRERERDGVDGEAGRAQDAGRRAGERQGAVPTLLRVVPSRRPAGATRRSSLRWSTSVRAGTRTRLPTSSTTAEAGCRAYKELHAAVRRAIVEYIVSGRSVTVRADKPSPIDVRYTLDGYIRFTDPDGFPAITPPWGTLTAIDLARRRSPGRCRSARCPGSGLTDTGQRELRRSGGDRRRTRVHRRNELRQEVPRVRRGARGRCCGRRRCRPPAMRRPAVYEVDGRQFVVIAAGGGKWGAPSGGSYVAFALPSRVTVNGQRWTVNGLR